jgi:hypothetical protein
MNKGTAREVIQQLHALPPESLILWRMKVVPGGPMHLLGRHPSRSVCGCNIRLQRMTTDRTKATCATCLRWVDHQPSTKTLIDDQYKRFKKVPT